MKIDFNPKDFLRLFKLAASVASTKYITPILQNVKIAVDKQDSDECVAPGERTLRKVREKCLFDPMHTTRKLGWNM